MSLETILSEDRRLVLLRTLSEAPGYALNEMVLHSALNALGHQIAHDVTRADLEFLKRNGLVRIEEISVPSGHLWIAHLTIPGQDVARGTVHPGVARLPAG